MESIVNVATVGAIPGTTMDDNCYGHSHNEIETLAKDRRILKARHHKIRMINGQALGDVGFRAYEEIHGLSETCSSRRTV